MLWPQEEALRHELTAARRPRLLLLGAEQVPPMAPDDLEDWVRFPLDADELASRSAALAERARGVAPRPVALRLEADDVLHAGERWVALPPREALVLATLLERPGELVRRDELFRAAWPSDPPVEQRALDGVIKRLRRRVAALDVRIHTAPRQGFLLDHVPGDVS